MWRFLNDDDKETRSELSHMMSLWKKVLRTLIMMDHWGDTPHAYAHEMAERVREDLR